MKLQKYLFPVIFFLQYNFLFAQNNQSPFPVNKGEILINNWNPELEQDAAQINQLTLKYSYSVYNSQPVGKYSLQWSIGNYFNYHQKRHTKNELNSDNFSEISIKTIRLKADVFSDGKYVTNVFIGLPDISVKTGGNLSSSVINNLSWSNIFERTYSKEAQEIFRDGFELRNIYIFEIEFEGFDFLDDSLKTEPADKIDKGVDYNQPAHLDRKESKNRKSLKDYFLSDAYKGKKNTFRGLSWHASINLAANYNRYPLIVNSYTDILLGTVIASDSISFKKAVGGIHGMLGGEFWPLFGNYIGLGIGVDAGIGGIPNLYGSYLGDFYLKLYIGAKEAKLLCEMTRTYRSGTYYESTDKIFNNGSSTNDIIGTGSFTINRLGIGARISWATVRTNYPFQNKRYFPFDADCLVIFDFSNDFLDKKVATLLKLNLWFYNYFNAGFEYSNKYPVGGDVQCRLDKNFIATGHYFSITAGKKIDFFGRPYLKKKK